MSVTRRRTVATLALAFPALVLAIAGSAAATVPQAAGRVWAAIPAIEYYKADHGTYAGMTAAKLHAIDRGVRNIAVKRAGKSTYCIQSTLAGPVVHFDGPKGPARRGPCGVRGAIVTRPRSESPDPPAAKTRVRAAVPAIEVYRLEHGSYAGLTLARIQAIDPGVREIRVVWARARGYCIQSGSGASTYHFRGPAGPVTTGSCPAAP